MLTDPSTVARPRCPLDQTSPMGQPRTPAQYATRRTLSASLAGALWRAREKSGVTNNEVARLTRVDPSYLSKIVRGPRCPSLVTAERMIVVLPLAPSEVEALRAVTDQGAGKSRLPG